MQSNFFILFVFITSIFSCQNTSDDKSNLPDRVKHELSSDFFQELYSNTYYDLIDRIEPDGYLEESTTGQYGGMYLRTVGAIVSLLIETGELKHAEHIINCAFDAMITNGLDRIPHVTDRKLFPNEPADSINNPYKVIGRTDQIDGQAHVIMAWAMLALHRGETDFENKTWNIASDLMTSSTQKPYFGLEKEGTISKLVHNYNFEHSRSGKSNYNLLTQCFIGSALELMILVAERRNENELASLWKGRIKILREGVQQHMIREVDGKDVYYELLSKENNTIIPFYGMGWVNLSPIAAQWEPLSHNVMINTVRELRKGMQIWNGVKWMPTDFWADGTFSGQMIGKGIGWEIEYCTQENDWERLDEIFNMLKIIQYKSPVYMENATLTNGTKIDRQHVTKTKLKELEQGIWKVVDAGNGEQVSWWCWSMARLRKKMGLNPVPERVAQIKQALANKKKNGLMYKYFTDTKKSPRVIGLDTFFNVNAIPSIFDDFRMQWKGYVKIEDDNDYRFFSYSANPSKLFVNGKILYQGGSNKQTGLNNESIYLKKGFYPIELTYDHILLNEQLEVFFQKGEEPKRELLRPDMLFYSNPDDYVSIPPAISPTTPEIEKGKTITVSLLCFDDSAKIYYSLDGREPTEDSELYNKEFIINSSTIVKAISIKNGLNKSAVSHVEYKEIPKRILFELKHPPHPTYSSRGLKTLNDKLLGSTNARDGKWLGFEGHDFDLTVNLQEVKDIHSIKVNFLHDQNSWIFAPKIVGFYISADGKNYQQIMVRKFNTSVNQSHLDPVIKSYRKKLENTKAQFVRIIGKSIEFVPVWHAGKGKAWIFVDEINIQSN
ncbi:MAG: hypothetical protein B6I20_00910 [Bacteroidetes bacterium 4572_117]|nr:MAG: hypothetical protein B6I20_00910 [Bacteroidetes bacterium 4572_117]